MTTGAVNNFKYPFAQPATGASAVSIQIFEPKAYTNPYIGKLPEGMESAYEIPEGNLYGPANTQAQATATQATATATTSQTTQQAQAQTATTPAQFQLTPEALQETINTAVQLAASKAVAEAMAKINAQNVTMVQNNATQGVTNPQTQAVQTPQGQMEAVATTPAPQVMPNSAIEETVPQTAQAVEEKPAEAPKEMTPAANVVATATVTVTPQAAEATQQAVEAPKAQATEAPQAQAAAPQVTTAPTDYKPVEVVDTNKIMEGLNSADLDIQTQTIDAIAKMSQAESEIALQLVDDNLMAKLAQIASVDTTKLEGPSKDRLKIAEKVKKGKKITDAEQQILDTVSPKEVAVKNKVISMYTLALLQKLQRDEVENYNALQANTGNIIPNVQLGELVGFKEIVNEAANAQTPVVRKAALQSIIYVLRADEGEVAKELLTPFANDKDVEIQKIAKEALATFNA